MTYHFTTDQLIQLFKVSNSILEGAEENRTNKKLVYALTKNSKTIRDKVTEIQSSYEDPLVAYQDYIESAKDIALKFGAEKRDNGDVDTNVDEFDRDGFKDEIEAFNQDNKDVLEKQTQINERNLEKKNKEYEIDLHSIQLDWFPENVTTKELPLTLIEIVE